MTPTTSTGKFGRRYRYYVSASLQQGKEAADGDGTWRLPAPQMEAFISEITTRLCRHDLRSSEQPVRRVQIYPTCVHILLDKEVALGQEAGGSAGLRVLDAKLGDGESASLDEENLIRIVVVRRLQFVGGKAAITNPKTWAIARHRPADPAIAKALKSAHAQLSERGIGPHSSPERLRDAKGAGNPHLRLISRLPFLAPDIQEAILDGRFPRHWNILGLTQSELPLAWADQRSYLCITS